MFKPKLQINQKIIRLQHYRNEVIVFRYLPGWMSWVGGIECRGSRVERRVSITHEWTIASVKLTQKVKNTGCFKRSIHMYILHTSKNDKNFQNTRLIWREVNVYKLYCMQRLLEYHVYAWCQWCFAILHSLTCIESLLNVLTNTQKHRFELQVNIIM